MTVESSDGGGEVEHDIVAAHTAGGNGDISFSVPTTLSQAMSHEDSEFWRLFWMK